MLSAYTNQTTPDILMAFAVEHERIPLDRRLLTAEQAAEFLGISPRQVQRLSVAGSLPHVKVGKLYRYRLPSLEQWAQDAEIRA